MAKLFEGLINLGGSAQLLLERARRLADLDPVVESWVAPCGRTLWLLIVEDNGKRKYFLRPYLTELEATRGAKRLQRDVAAAPARIKEHIKTHYLLDQSGTQIVHARFFTFGNHLVSRGSRAHVTPTKDGPTIRVWGRRVPVEKAIAILRDTDQRWRGEFVPIVPCVAGDEAFGEFN